MKSVNICLLLLLPLFAVAQKPINLTVGENFINPVGYSLDDLSFSWQLPSADNLKQVAYQIQVVSDIEHFSLNDVDLSRISIWDTRKVESSQSVNIPFFRKLASGERLYWRVKYWDNKGEESNWSDVNFFEAGDLSGTLPKGEWISCAFEPKKTIPTITNCLGRAKSKPKTEVQPTYFRKEFETKKPIKKARLRVASLGIYQVYLNGEKVGDEFWGTGWTDYSKRVQVDTFDVTEKLKNGENAIGAILADGWYSGRISWLHKGVYGDIPALKICLEVIYNDGSTDFVFSDDSWKFSYGAIQYSDIYMGEKYDARLEMKGWNKVDFDDSKWSEKPLVNAVTKSPKEEPRRDTPIRAMNYLIPISVKKIADKTYIFDMGQNMVGVVDVKLSASKNQKITLRYAEMLNSDGTLYTENYRSAASRDEFISNGKTTIWSPTFTFHGFRYVEVSGIDYEPDVDDLRGIVLHNDMKETAGFSCSNALINKLQSCIIWGQKSNFFSVPTDCPQRDERFGWTGDAVAFVATAAFNMDVRAFFHKWTLDLRDAQRPDGNVPWIIPDVLNDANGAPFWGDSAVIIPWEIYMAYGDLKILKNSYDSMKKWVEFQKSSAKDFIRPNGGFGDWLQPFSKKWTGDTRNDIIATAYFAYTAEILSKTAEILGKKEDVKPYKQLSDDVKKAFDKRFVKDDGQIECDTQTAYVVPLNLDIILPEKRAKVFEKFLSRLKKDGYYLRTGFIGTPHLNPTLSKFGRSDLAYRLLLNKEYPSWLYPVLQGATTMWERWNSYTHKDGFGDANMNSFNHYAYGAIGQWIYKDVGGIWYADAGYSKILFAPTPNAELSPVSLWRETPYGKATSKWSFKDGKMNWKISIPSNTEGVVVFKTSDSNSILINGKPLIKFDKSPEGIPTATLGSGVYNIYFDVK